MFKKKHLIMVNVNCDDKEWVRRRQMRIVQVRMQSNDIAKRLRERVINEERQRRVEEKNLLDKKLHLWKVKRLKNLEEMYREAISDFGEGHKMAAVKPNPAKEIKKKHEEYLCKAKERGECALEVELKGKKEAAEKKQIPIQRKMITRKIEDLRSSLICSIPVKEPSVILRDIYAGKIFDPKKFEHCELREQIKSNSRKGETIKKKEKSPAKTFQEENFTTKKTGKFQLNTRKKIVSQIVPKSGVISHRNNEEKTKSGSPICENNWVNLGAIETLTKEKEVTKKENISNRNLQESEIQKGSKTEKNSKEKEKVLKSGLLGKKVTPVKQKPVIECHGVSVHQNCKLKDSICIVQSPLNFSEPSAIELALKEEEKLLLEKNEKETRKNVAEERGNKALEKQKIIKNYNELLLKLEKLSTKEKLIKSYCHIPPAHLFFSDERRKEKSARKQRIMDSEFERIYYDVTGTKPCLELNTRLNLGPSVEEVKPDSESGSVITKLDFSKFDSNLKTQGPASNFNPNNNSPASSNESKTQRESELARIRSPVEKVYIKKTPSSFHFKRKKIIKGDSKALLEIDRILKKCQELRQESRSDADPLPRHSGPEGPEKKAELNFQSDSISCKSTENGSIELQFFKSDTSSQCEGNRVSDIKDLKSSPRKNPSPQEKTVLEDLAMGDMPRNFIGIRNNVIACPVYEINRTKPGKKSSGRSSSTSYRSLPPEIHPKSINSLLEILAVLKEREGKAIIADELIIKLENLLSSLVHDAERNDVNLNEKDCQNFQNNPRLSYYISKLLGMSRETVAELSSSSESNTSVPKIPMVCDNQADRTVLRSENKYLKQINGNNKILKLTRAEELEEIIKKWKLILDKQNSFEDDLSLSDEIENAAQCTREEEKKDEEKYRDIAQICSDRMAVLSRVLANCKNKGYMEKTDQEYGEAHVQQDEGIQEPANEGHNYIVDTENKNPGQFCCTKKGTQECYGSKSTRKKKLDYCDDNICPFQKPLNDVNNVNCQKGAIHHSGNNSVESLPNVMEELLKKKIISSPFQWSQGNLLSDNSPKGSCHSRKSKGGSIHEDIKHINQVNKLPEKNEQECPKAKVNKCLYRLHNCKDSCKGSCATGANNVMEGVKQSPKKPPVPEKIVQENSPICEAEFPTKTIERPWKRKGSIRYSDNLYGIFSPVSQHYGAWPTPKPTNVSPEIYPVNPDELFKKKTYASRYTWDENTRDFVVNPSGTPMAQRPCWEPQGEIPKSPGITITSVKKKPQGASKRPSSSPVGGHMSDWERRDSMEFTNPCKILHFDEEPPDPYCNVMSLKEPEHDLMKEWIRRNMASKSFNRKAGEGGSCAGSCAVHCNKGYNLYDNRPNSSRPAGNYRVENYQRGASSSPDMREFERARIQGAEFPPRYGYEVEYEEEDDYEDSQDCARTYDIQWGQNFLQDLNESSRF